jgi:hypothetical protein
VGVDILTWILSNPWRTACLAVAVLLFVACGAVKYQSMRLETSQANLKAAQASLVGVEAQSIKDKEKQAQALKELTELLTKHAREASRLRKEMESWPSDCDGAAAEALKAVR